MENNNKESLKLLNMSDSNSESDVPEFTLPPKTRRKVRVKKKARGGVEDSGHTTHFKIPIPSLWHSLVAAAWLLLAGWLGTLFWYSLNLQAQVQRLSQDLSAQEARNQNLPEAMHEYHGILQDLQKNQSIIFTHIVSFTTQFDALGKQLAALGKDLDKLQERLKASPELVQLPKDLQEVQNSVASFGSKISDLETTSQSLRSQQESFKVAFLDIRGNISALQSVVTKMKFVPQDTDSAAQKAEAKNVAILGNFTRITSNLDAINKTLSGKLQWAEDDLHKHHGLIAKLQDTSQNLSARISTIETAHGTWGSLLFTLNSTTGQLTSQSKQLLGLESNVDRLRTDVGNLQTGEVVLKRALKEMQQYQGVIPKITANPSTRQPVETSSAKQTTTVPELVTDSTSHVSQTSAASSSDEVDLRT